jgi:predicted Fe-S protein YdhL (DUF1289 family)
MGCFRSLPEVVGWADADNVMRQYILNNTNDRKAAYQERFQRLKG